MPFCQLKIYAKSIVTNFNWYCNSNPCKKKKKWFTNYVFYSINNFIFFCENFPKDFCRGIFMKV